MRITRTYLLLAALLLGVAVAVPSIASLASAGNDHSAAAVTKSTTGRFHNLAAAEKAGYALFPDAKGIKCIDNQPVGGMGVHYVNGSLVGDTVLDPTQPEALVYAPNADGQPKLAALEYIVFQQAWDAEHSSPPSLFGTTFNLTPDGNRFGIPVLLPPRLGVGAELQRPAAALEPARALLSPDGRGGAAQPPPLPR
jgi:hypothetical protein